MEVTKEKNLKEFGKLYPIGTNLAFLKCKLQAQNAGQISFKNQKARPKFTAEDEFWPSL